MMHYQNIFNFGKSGDFLLTYKKYYVNIPNVYADFNF